MIEFNQEEWQKRVLQKGEGVPILLLHGMGGPNPLNYIEENLQNDYRVIKPIMPGFIDSDGNITYSLGKKWVSDMMKKKVVRQNFIDILTTIGVPIIDLDKKCKELTMPTLILWAEEDKTASIHWGYKLKEWLPNAQIFTLPKYRHMAPIEQPQFYAEHIRRFIE